MSYIKRAAQIAGLALVTAAAQPDTHSREEVLNLSEIGNPAAFTLRSTELLELGSDEEGLTQAQLLFTGYRASFGRSSTEPQDWSPYNLLCMKIANREPRQVRYRLLVYLSADPKDATNIFSGDAVLRPLETKRFVFHLNTIDPRPFGLEFMRPVLTAPYTSVYSTKVARNLSTIYHWRLSSQEELPARADISDVRLLKQETYFTGMVDRYGQYTDRTWPGKVSADTDFPALKAAELTDLAANPGPGEVEGTTSLAGEGSPTGRWSVVSRASGMKYLQHPNGRLFWCLGVSAIQPGVTTPVQGREHYFESLPDRTGTFNSCYGVATTKDGRKLCFNHHEQNLMIKYGRLYESSWLGNVRTRLSSWGLNSLGIQCHPALYDNSIPYTLLESTKEFPVRLTVPITTWGTMADPYSGSFQQWLIDRFKSSVAPHNGKRNFMGIYVDNELAWGHMRSQAGRYNLALGALKAPSNQPAKKALVYRLQRKYGGIEALNAAWGTSFAGWGDLLNGRYQPTTFTSGMEEDFQVHNRAFAGQYHSKVRAALNAAGCTGLYLGVRYTADYNEDVIAAANMHVDAHSFNLYRTVDRVDWDYLNSLGKPVIISEVGFGVQGGNTFGGPGEVSSQEEREACLRAFLERARSTPNIIGVQLYCYADQPLTGRWSDYENAGLGLVNVTDTPYYGVVNMLRQFSRSMYVARG